MRKPLIAFVAVLLMSMPALATYWVVMKDGTKYKAKSKWTVTDGKAVFTLDSGTVMQVDPSSIDPVKSEETTRLGGASLLVTQQNNAPAPKAQTPSLGSTIRLRKLPSQQTATATETTTAPPTSVAPPGGGAVSGEVIEKFARAYENVGIFEEKVTANGPHSVHVELTADNEEKVFNAISATSFLIVRNAGVPGAQIDMVELFMKTTTGGAAGRFQMTREDATALDGKQLSREEYFVRRVIY